MTRPAPAVWVLQGARSGDNSQARELARRLGVPFALKRLRYNRLHLLPNHLLRAGLASLDSANSDALAPPWPDLVIAVGKRAVPVARWIKARSGGRARLVHLGRPRAPLSWLDLVVTTPQYGLPPAANVIELPLPLVARAEPAADVLDRWRPCFAPLPRPWTGVLVGGARFPIRFDRAAATRLGRQASAHARSRGGALLVSTSPRTGARQADALNAAIDSPAHLHLYDAGGDNPHEAILALADDFLVTSDSLSLRAEALATGRPITVFALPVAPFRPRWTAQSGLGAALARAGILSPPVDIANAGCRADPAAEAAMVARVRSLIAG